MNIYSNLEPGMEVNATKAKVVVNMRPQTFNLMIFGCMS